MKRQHLRSKLTICVLFPSLALAAAPAPAASTPEVPAGAVFHFFGMVYMAGRIEFRDTSPDPEQLFPNYWYEGKFGDVRGQLVFDPQNPKMNMTLVCTSLCQPNDGADLKILGEVMKPGKAPAVRFTVNKMQPWQPASPEKKIGPCETAVVDGELDVDGRKLNVKGNARLRYNTPKGGDLRGLSAGALLGFSINMTVDFTIKGKELGLQKVADREIRVTVHSRAFSEETILQNRKKKTLEEAGVKQ